MRTWLRILAALWLAAVAGLPQDARADDYPSRPITLIVPFPPGGSTTVMARNVADQLAVTLGQQIVVDNRGGAGGTIGTRAAAKAAPDGYTIVLGYTGTLSIAPSLYANPGYDPRKDFAPIGMIGTAPSVLVVHPSVPVKSVAELIDYAKALDRAAAIRLARRRHRQSSRRRIVRQPGRHQAARTFPTRARGRR